MLKIRERIGISGRIRITVREHETPDAPGLIVAEYDFENLVVDVGLNQLRLALFGTGIDAAHRYLAWGSGTTAPASGDTTLETEDGRKAVTSQTVSGTTGRIDTTTYLASADANGQIDELGWFISPSATASADSGILLARVLFSELKTTGKSIQVDREDTLG